MRTAEQKRDVRAHLYEAARMIFVTLLGVEKDDEESTYFTASRQQIALAQEEWDKDHKSDKG